MKVSAENTQKRLFLSRRFVLTAAISLALLIAPQQRAEAALPLIGAIIGIGALVVEGPAAVKCGILSDSFKNWTSCMKSTHLDFAQKAKEYVLGDSPKPERAVINTNLEKNLNEEEPPQAAFPPADPPAKEAEAR